MLQLTILFQYGFMHIWIAELGFQITQLAFHTPYLGEGIKHLFPDGVIARQFRALWQEADARAFGDADAAFGRRIMPHEQVKQCCFTSAVRPDQRDA